VTVQVWVYLPGIGLEPERIAATAAMAEMVGFEGLALMDHLVMPMAHDTPILESMTLAAWIAAKTSTLRLGHLVLCDALRHAAVLAKQAVTLDRLSTGRFELGIGSGSWDHELVGFGVTTKRPAERIAGLERSIVTMRALWDGTGELQQRPLPLRSIPITVGGVGPRTLAVARAHADWWNLPAPDIGRLDELRPHVGTAQVSVQLAVKLVGVDDDPVQARERIVARLGDFGTGLVVGSAVEVADRVQLLGSQGVQRTYLWLLGNSGPAEIARLGREVLPLVS
jgi:alkanesulfonate monooxygenase SsuD/methylene tetrahydromethanopterin reductase-like flavin-dependent oxidoreductase (luciferase family)